VTITAQVPDLELAPADPAAVALFTAHRVGDTLHALAHATQRMKAARAATGDLRAHHSDAVRGHLADALNHGHQLVTHIRGHYPAEAAELEQVRQHIGLAKAVSGAAKTATTAHLLETVLHEETHGIRHADAMTGDPDDDEVWGFNADHAEKHLGGAVEHAGKLADHFRDNYPEVAKWLPRPPVTAEGGGPQHARYSGTVTTQLAAPAAISEQVDLAAIHGHHIPGTDYTYRHGWVPLIGQQLNDKYPKWFIDQHAAKTRAAPGAAGPAPKPPAHQHPEMRNGAAPRPSAAQRRQTAASQAAPPAADGGDAAKTTADTSDDAAFAKLALPDAQAKALKAYIDARVATEVAARMGAIDAAQHAAIDRHIKALHVSQQKLIAHVRKGVEAGSSEENRQTRTKLVMNNIFNLSSLAIALSGITMGVAPIIAAIAAAVVPAANIAHDYARRL
jgi:hypothetical protein